MNKKGAVRVLRENGFRVSVRRGDYFSGRNVRGEIAQVARRGRSYQWQLTLNMSTDCVCGAFRPYKYGPLPDIERLLTEPFVCCACGASF